MEKELLRDVPIGDIKPYPNNPRKNAAAVAAVKESITQFDYLAPILVDEEGVVLAGHTRLLALKELGRTAVPEVIRVSGMPEAKKRAYRIADNSTAGLAQWDEDMLRVELTDLVADFDFPALGLDPDLIPGREAAGDPDDVPPPPVDTPIQRGDIFQVDGRHRVMCGDATSRDNVSALMDSSVCVCGRCIYKPSIQCGHQV